MYSLTIQRILPLPILELSSVAEGARAAAAYSGAVAPDDKVFRAACTKSHILALKAFSDLSELPKSLATQPLPKGNRLGVMAFAERIVLLAIDKGAGYGLNVSRLMPQTRDSDTSIRAIGMSFRYTRIKKDP